MKICALVCLALAISGAASANTRVQTDDGDYGDSPTFLNPDQCLGINGALLTPAVNCAMTGEDYIDSANDTELVYDFLIDGNRSNFTLTLTGSEAFPADNNQFPFSYGAFSCDTFSDVQCGPDPTSQLALGSPTLSSNGMTVTFDVTGTNNGFDFFVVEPDTSGKVTAQITQNTSSTPEPGSFSLVFGAGLAVAAFGLRRLAKAL
jgi:opacity protein-like surface antigen